MNAYELADELIRTPYEPIKGDCASMLRQQADRIAELEKQLNQDMEMCGACGGFVFSPLIKQTNAEPVAWMTVREDDEGKYPVFIEYKPSWDDSFIPLYTTPQTKELSDEEILEVWRENERVYPMDRSRLLDRTRACIKKASEK